jgi:hypothetical protein
MDPSRTTTSRTLHRRSSARRRASVVPAVVLTLALLAAACGGGDDAAFDVTDQMSMPAQAAPSMPDIAFDDSAGAKLSGEIAPNLSSGVEGRADDGRALVRNASIELVVDDGAAAVDAVAAQVLVFGGHVTTTALSRDEDGTVSGTLVLRVPADRLDELVDALDELARSVPFRTIDEMDVTLELSDLDARLANLRAFEDELRTLLTEVRERDGTVEGLVAVAAQLNAVRTEIDMFEGRRIQLADQVAMSTVFVSVRQARSTTPVVGTWDLPTVVRDALAATVRLGQLVVEGVVWLLLTVVPALIALVVVVGIVRSIRHRRAPAPADVDLPS